MKHHGDNLKLLVEHLIRVAGKRIRLSENVKHTGLIIYDLLTRKLDNSITVRVDGGLVNHCLLNHTSR